MMYRLRLFPSALALSLLVGCAGEEGAGTAPPPSAGPSPAPSAAPKVPGVEKPAAPAPAPAADAEKEKAPAPTPAADDKKAEEKPDLAAPKAELSEEEKANVKKLPDEADQKAALVQAVCPVSDEHLGAMDTPIKVTAEGRTFYLCCGGCQDEVKSNPKAVLAKLDALVKK